MESLIILKNVETALDQQVWVSVLGVQCGKEGKREGVSCCQVNFISL